MENNDLGPDYDQEFSFKKHSDKLRLKSLRLKFLRLYNVFFLAWVVWVLICLSLGIGMICVAIHFISKFW